ncbi:Por secretion system C-terminal sorting domain-containing protein [Reichenbachiella agariperforans]|uniref:Por secretion system C-terminal sorting domain-containing protein n=1 Tax=Reichenbachiella agariperforans TaxID=156994 RepID=A0A1M6LZ49_REIAG|nr:RICIN domain-containing protein [Reichenbachiella agariperforans]SHJ76445.1 Por secretion system C-terminal sorting domain-containing protein [Reichenbachiella agariperforans]
MKRKTITHAVYDCVHSKLKRLVALAVLLLTMTTVYAQTTVSSLSQLIPYLDDDNVNVKLAPGTYSVTANDVSTGAIGKYWQGTTHLGNSFNVFLFEGDNSTYDFTGVTINIETETAQSVGNVDFHEFRIIGSDNVILNLTVVDDGSVNDQPTKRATNVVLDGANNRLEGCHFTVRGSYPYGYGDIFGKGGSNVIAHNKRSACLIRGNSNHVKNSTFICRSYGHGIFFQGANDPIVEGCYVEGELRSTNEVLAEEGSGSPADNVDFQTIWGFNLNDITGNYYFSLQEDGIRSYNAGETVIDGVEYDRGVTNATVLNSTVVKMRSGVTIGWASGTKYVENCTVLACETGYWVGANTNVVNCDGDASIGALLSEDVARSNSNIEITLLDNHVTPLSGEVTAIYFAGTDHEVTIHDGTTSTMSNIDILIGGQRKAHRFMTGNGSTTEGYYHNANNITFTNNTNYAIVVGDKATNTDITTCGTVTDNGTGTSVNYQTCTNDNIALGKSTSQSSTAHGGLSSRAVDGNTSGVWSHGSVTHTNAESNPWWEVDLGGAYEVDEIVLYNRTNCCMDRLSNFTVSVMNGSTTTWSQTYSAYPNPSQTIQVGGAQGETVRVQLNGSSNPLSLAEVQVYGTVASTVGGDFQLVKRNATGFAIDGGGNSSAEGRSVELYTYVQHDNMTWTEISRGGGYYSYQKLNSTVCIDGGSGGANGQDVTLETCNANDYNQHWLKIDAGNGHYRLEKRGTNFSLDGGNNGAIDQNVYLWTSSTTNQNQQWRFDDVSAGARFRDEPLDELASSAFTFYPNPVSSRLTVQLTESSYQQFVIYNVNGMVVNQGKVADDMSKLTIDMDHLDAGLYVLKFSGNNASRSMRIIKE